MHAPRAGSLPDLTCCLGLCIHMVGRECGNLQRKLFFFFILGFSLLLLLFSVGKKVKAPSLF